jgi:hypothetical protein
MIKSGRIVCRVPVKTVADRRARYRPPTLPPTETEFTELERNIFRELDRRLKRR